MFRQVRTTVVVLTLGVLAASCSENADNAVSSHDPEGSASTPVAQAASMPLDMLVPVAFAEWETRRAELTPDIVVVDLWATWCTPCLERFPHMVDMYQKYKGQGVEFVSLSLDDREDEASIVFARQFLEKQKAGFAHYLLDENVIDGMDMVGVQTIPAVNVYDRRGELAFALNNNDPNRQFTDQDIDSAIQSLLASD